jgi:hypothetical protein
MSHANWRLDNPPVVDVAVSRRMGLFVVGRLAARHGVRVRLRPAQAGGLTALIWLPDTVAAPEVGPPLGRLRRFEADDYGPAPSLSAPPLASGPGAQATSAARIPRFSPISPSSPPSPSFTPAASAGTPGSGTPGVVVPEARAPGAEAGGNGWNVGEPSAKLPVRDTNGTANGNAGVPPVNGLAGDGAEQASPRAPLAAPGPAVPGPAVPGPAVPGPAVSGPATSRLPSFGAPAGIPASGIGSQNVHGGDGPSAGDPAAGGTPGTDGAADSGQVTVPPATQNQRLPIFDSLESDWFRRSGKTLSTARPAPGGQEPQVAPAEQAAAESAWVSPADEGWRAAEALSVPAAGDTTQAGLPKRVPRANLVPGSVGSGNGEAEAPTRSPDAARTRMASFQRGVREGRAAAPQIEEPKDR